MMAAGVTNRLGNYLYFYLEITFLWLWYKSLRSSHLLSSIFVKKKNTYLYYLVEFVLLRRLLEVIGHVPIHAEPRS
ncbi:hypothetical protein BJX66DRAFT_28738 [Aspergillus keveii]|uniref:Uncharacterized protein n=1 Tax=Aspergillus keveii TaxID=714993 RepID=A0ABR4FTF2_9EURO